MKKRIGNLLGSVRSGAKTHSERRRLLKMESLEGRQLLAADLSLLHHNHLIAEDANSDFRVTPLDALLVINAINTRGIGPLGGSEGEPSSAEELAKIDVSGDNFLSPLDILLVINRLNAEGENDALMGYTYQITNTEGTPISPNSITVGQEFRVNVLVQDLRPADDAAGVFTSSIDLGVSNLDLVEFQAANTQPYRIQFGPLFGNELAPSGGTGGGLQIPGDPTNATVRDGDRFSLNSVVFEFDTNSIVEGGNVPVVLPSTSTVSFTTVGNALVSAINGSSLGVTATLSRPVGVVVLPDNLQPQFDALNSNVAWSDVEVEFFNEISASINPLASSGPVGPVLFFSAQFLATTPGTVTFNPNHQDFIFNENLLFGSTVRIPNELVMVGDSFSVTILSDPSAPIAQNDTVSSPEDVVLNFEAAVLLANDIVTAPRTLSLVSVNAIPGTTLGALNGLAYTPPANYFGQDLVTYTIQDSTGLRSTGTVTLNITPVNDPPVANPDSFIVVEDSVNEPLTGLLNNDNAGPGETGPIRISGVGVPNNGGTVSIAANQLGLLYTPAPGFVGTETFSYTISDEGDLTATALVTVEVEPLTVPRARLDLVTFNEDTRDNPIDVLANDRVNENQRAILLSVTQPANGTVTIDTNGTPGDLTDDSILYTPNPNFFGTDVFTYVMNDTLVPQGENSIGTVTVTVNDVNDPVMLENDTRSATEDVVATYSLASLLANDSPGLGEDGRQTLTITAVTPVGAGGTVAIQGSNVVYTPTPNFNGTFRFTYTAVDNGVPVSSGTATVTVTVAAVNDDPVAGADNVATNEDTLLTIATATLLANDSPGPPDESSQVLSVASVSATSSNGGTVSLSGTTVTYRPAADFNGVDTFTYVVSDGVGGTGTGTVTVSVAPINDAPIAVADSVVAFKDFPATIQPSTLLANDRPGPANESTQTLRITAVIANANTNGTVTLNADGTISYVPAEGYTGPASFQYRVEDNGPTGGTNVNFALGTVNVTVQEFVPSVISGLVWVDETQDGLVDAAERRLGGVAVTLSGTSLGEPMMPITLRTLADGSYSFDEVAPGQYTVSYVAPTFMLDNTSMPDSYTITIVEPGGVNDSDNHFAVIGLNPSHARTLDQLASRYTMVDQSLIYNGAYFALGANGAMLWGANLDGFEGTDFSEAVLDGNDLLLTVVDQTTHAVHTARLARGEYLTIRDSSGHTLVRVLGGRGHFDNWQSIDLASPPVVSSARYLEAVDEIFDQEGW